MGKEWFWRQSASFSGELRGRILEPAVIAILDQCPLGCGEAFERLAIELSVARDALAMATFHLSQIIHENVMFDEACVATALCRGRTNHKAASARFAFFGNMRSQLGFFFVQQLLDPSALIRVGSSLKLPFVVSNVLPKDELLHGLPPINWR
jgi:hypothetical protein